jgi:hypothetical protein
MKAMSSMSLFDLPSASVQSKSNEWYTPAKYIEAAREVMGGIDLDPASCEMANRVVKAKRYYTKEDDGLSNKWHAESVWCNPPYGNVVPLSGAKGSYQRFFVQKLLVEYKKRNIEQAIVLLLGNCCFNRYFVPLWDYPICFHDGNIYFYREDGSRGLFGFGTCFVYLGSNESKFVEVFSQFGRIAKAIDTPKPKLTPLTLWEVNNSS